MEGLWHDALSQERVQVLAEAFGFFIGSKRRPESLGQQLVLYGELKRTVGSFFDRSHASRVGRQGVKVNAQ